MTPKEQHAALDAQIGELEIEIEEAEGRLVDARAALEIATREFEELENSISWGDEEE